MEQLQIITVYTENTVGVLGRITNIFIRRKINIESLNVCETEHRGVSKFTITCRTTPEIVEVLLRSIERIVEVYQASHGDANFRPTR